MPYKSSIIPSRLLFSLFLLSQPRLLFLFGWCANWAANLSWRGDPGLEKPSIVYFLRHGSRNIYLLREWEWEQERISTSHCTLSRTREKEQKRKDREKERCWLRQIRHVRYLVNKPQLLGTAAFSTPPTWQRTATNGTIVLSHLEQKHLPVHEKVIGPMTSRIHNHNQTTTEATHTHPTINHDVTGETWCWWCSEVADGSEDFTGTQPPLGRKCTWGCRVSRTLETLWQKKKSTRW